MKDKYFIASMIMFLIVGLIMALWIWFDHQRWLDEPRVMKPLFPIVNKVDLRHSHLYHGINYARQNDNGKWFFICDGQKCKLFAYRERR